MNEQHLTAPGATPAPGWARRLTRYAAGFALLATALAAQAAAPIFVSSPGNLTMDEDGNVVVQANVSDADGDTIALSAVSGNSSIIPNGGLVVTPSTGGNGARSISITPAPNQNGGPVQITLTAIANGDSATALFTVNVLSVNDVPVTAADTFAPVEDTAFSSPTSVLVNDSDLQGGAPGENNLPLTAVLGAGPSSAASFNLASNGTFSYTPAANFNGADSFTYRARDSLGGESVLTTVTLNVSSVNDLPIAGADAYSVAEDQTLTVAAPGVLGNDSDPVEGSPITAVLVTDVSNGSLSLSSDGAFSYTPAANYFGSDSFTYSANDGSDNSAPATVTITVSPINDEPSFAAVNPPASDEDAGAQTVAGWAAFNAGPGEGSQSVIAYTISGVTNGGLFSAAPVVANNGTLTYTAVADSFGTSTFDVSVQDDGGTANVGDDDTSQTLSFTITVNSVNDLPIAGADAYSVAEDQTLTVTAPGVLSNDSDPVEASPITAALVSNVSNGTLNLNANGSFTYTPAANYFGADSFTYSANDGGDNSAPATVTITVSPINDEPSFTAVNPPASDEDAGAQTVASWAAFNAGPGEGSQSVIDYTISGVTNDGLFSAAPVVANNGTLTYTAVADSFGTSTFDVSVQDDGGTANVGDDDTSQTLSFTITVNSVNDLPIAGADAYSVAEDQTLTVAAPGVLGNDSDPVEGSPITAVLVTDVSNGSLSLSSDGAFSYTPAANYFGADSFTYSANDGGDNSAPATVTITVSPINDEPSFTAVNPPASDEDAGAQTVASWAAFNAGPGEGSQSVIDYTISGVTNDGLFSAAPVVANNGTLTYTAVADSFGTSTFDVSVQDDGGTANVGDDDTSQTLSFTITVNSVNDQPNFTALDPPTVFEDSGANLVAGWVTSFDPGAANESGQGVFGYGVQNISNIGLFAMPPNVSPSGDLSYTLAPNAFGSTTFEVAVQDDGGTANNGINASAYQTFTLTVTGVNDAPTFSAAGPVASDEDAGPQSVPDWAAFDPGPNESDAVVGYSVTNISNSGLFSVEPAVSPAGILTYTAAANANGVSTFQVLVQDNGGTANGGQNLSALQTFTITVNSVNDIPNAGADAYSVAEDQILTVAVPGVLVNDSDPVEASPITAVLVTDVSNGTLNLSANGGFTYTPAANYFGSDSFTYSANDGSDNSAPATVTITVSPVNDAPVADDDTFSVDENSSPGTAVGGVVAIDIEMDTLSYAFSGFGVDPASPTTVLSTDGVNIDVSTLSYSRAQPTVRLAQDAFFQALAAAWNGPASGASYSASTGVFTVTNTFWASLIVDLREIGGPFVDLSFGQSVSMTVLDLTPPTTTDTTVNDGVFAINPTTGAITVSGSLDFETTPSYLRLVRVTDDGTPSLSDDATITINLNDLNEGPSISDIADLAINEDTSTGPLAFSVADPDNAASSLVTTAVSSNEALVPSASLVIAGTGANRTIAASPLPDAFGVTTITVTVSDGQLSASDSFKLTVTSINDAPRFELVPDDIAALDEDAVITGINGLAVRVIDPENGPLTVTATSGNQYLLPNANLGIAGSGNDRTINFTLATDKNSSTAASDFQSGQVTVTLQAFDSQGASTAEEFIIQSVTPVNDAPSFTGGAAQNILEDAAAQSVNWATAFRPGPTTATDEASQTAVAYSLTALVPPTVSFSTAPAISAAGVLTYSTAPDSFGTAVFEVRVIDNGSGVAPNVNTSAPRTLTINVAAVNDAPVANDTSGSVNENAANGTAVATVTATDVDGDTLTFAITGGNVGAAFAINPSTGVVSVAGPIDFETLSAYSLTVTATDSGTPALSDTATVTITVNDVNEAPVANDTAGAVDENSIIGTAVATVTASDVDAGQTLIYAIAAGNVGTAFAINSTSGAITVAGPIDFETLPSYSLTVTVSDSGVPVLSDTATVTVTVNDINDAPVADDIAASVDENSVSAAAVVTVPASDQDADTLTFAITAGNTGSAFAINPATGAITVAGALDFETLASYTLTVSVTDDGVPVLSDTATVSITVNNVNDAPTATDASGSIAENSTIGTAVTTVLASDADAGQTLSYAITDGNVAAAFAINSTTGAISVAGALDFETLSSYTLTVTVTDSGTPALSDTATVTITVLDANDAPVANDVTASVLENSASGTAVVTVPASDQDLDPLTYAITGGNVGAAFAIDAGTGAITVAGPIDFETLASYTLTVSVTDDGTPVLSDTATVTIDVINANDAPVASNGSATALEDTNQAFLLAASDIDSDPLIWTVVTPPTKGTLSGTAPNLTYTPNANSNGVDSFTFKVNDGNADSNTATFTLNVTPVNDAPGFTVGANQTPAVGQTGVVTVPGFITNISAGPADEVAQAVSLLVVESDTANVTSALTINASGDLSYTLTGNGGVATVTVRAQDDGGTANGGIDTSAMQVFTISAVSASVDLSIVKTGRYVPGNLVVWTLNVGNAGPGPANGARVIDNLPASVSAATWTCSGSAGGACTVASGGGNIDSTVNLPNGGSAVFTITATLVNPNASTVVNTASVAAAMGIIDTDLANNSSTLDLQVALFADGFEGGGPVIGKLTSAAQLQTVELSGSQLEKALRGIEPQDAARYSGADSDLLVQVREINGLVEARLLQKEGKGLWSSTRWIELWPGDVVRIDYSKAGGELQSRLSVGPQQ